MHKTLYNIARGQVPPPLPMPKGTYDDFSFYFHYLSL